MHRESLRGWALTLAAALLLISPALAQDKPHQGLKLRKARAASARTQRQAVTISGGPTLWMNVLTSDSVPHRGNLVPGFYSFDTSRNDTLPLLREKHNSYVSPGYGSAVIDGIFYSMEGDLTSATYGYAFGYLYAYSTDTWQQVGDERTMSYGGYNVLARETAQNYQTGTVYGEFWTDDLYGYEWGTIDYVSFTRTGSFGTPSRDYVALGVTSDNTLYGIGDDGNLYSISTTDGTETLVGPTGLTLIDPEDGATYSQTGEIDQQDNTFYWAATLNDGTSGLYTVDLQTGHATRIADLPGNAQAVSMAIAPRKAAAGAPQAAQNLSLVFAGGELQGKATFTMPTLATDGSELSGQLAWTVTEAGQTLASGEAAPGAQVEAAFSVVRGYHEVSVVVANASGQSPAATVKQWIGFDQTTAPRLANLDIYNATGDANITWSAPAKTLHDGYMGPLTYDVYRFHGEDSTLVATGVSTTSYTDHLTKGKPTSYHYGIIADNGGVKSAPAYTQPGIIGDAYDVPYEETFGSKDAMDFWTIIDANNDGNTWKWSTYPGGVNTSQYNYYHQADDWLISPPVKLYRGRHYTVSFRLLNSGRDLTDAKKERIAVSYGMGTVVEAMAYTLLDTTVVDQADHTWTFDLSVPADGEYNIGFHDISDDHADRMTLSSLSITGEASGVAPGPVSDLTITPDARGELKADISFRAPEIAADSSRLSELSRVVVKRDNAVIHTFTTVAPGQQLTMTDSTVQYDDFYTYTITPYLGNDFGADATQRVYVGLDRPRQPLSVSLTDLADSILVSWVPNPLGADSGYVDLENTQYYIFDRLLGGNRLAEVGKGATSLMLPYDCDNGDQAELTLAVAARNRQGASSRAWASMLVGKPYSLPFTESFPSAKPTHDTWHGYGTEIGYTNLLSADGDRGAFVFQGTTDNDDAVLQSGKISLLGTATPQLAFSYYAHPGADITMRVEATTPEGVTYALQTVDFTTLDGDRPSWRRVNVSLDRFRQSRYVTIGFRFHSESRGVETLLDDILVDDIPVYNLSARLSAPARLVRGRKAKVSLTAVNNGTNAVSGYTASVSVNGREVASQQVNETVEPFQSHTITIDVPTNMAEADTAATLTGTVSYAYDLRDEDNSASVTLPLTTIDVAGVGNLQASGSPLSLSWTEPEADSHQVVETFDTYSPWAINFGDWAQYDRDGGMPYKWSDPFADYDHSDEPFGFIVFNYERMTGSAEPTYPMLAAHSGQQYAAAIHSRNAYGAVDQDNWLVSPRLPGVAQKIALWVHNVLISSEGQVVNSPETFDLLYSSTTADPDSFQPVRSDSINSGDWTRMEFDVPEGALYFAIHHTTNAADALIFGVDDVEYVGGEGAAVSYNVYVDGELVTSVPAPAANFAVPAAYADGNHVFTVTAVYADGTESRPATVSPATAISTIDAPTTKLAGPVYDLSGRRVASEASAETISRLPRGVYIVGGKKIEVLH